MDEEWMDGYGYDLEVWPEEAYELEPIECAECGFSFFSWVDFNQHYCEVLDIDILRS